jgi:hypothetical protein
VLLVTVGAVAIVGVVHRNRRNRRDKNIWRIGRGSVRHTGDICDLDNVGSASKDG